MPPNSPAVVTGTDRMMQNTHRSDVVGQVVEYASVRSAALAVEHGRLDNLPGEGMHEREHVALGLGEQSAITQLTQRTGQPIVGMASAS